MPVDLLLVHPVVWSTPLVIQQALTAKPIVNSHKSTFKLVVPPSSWLLVGCQVKTGARSKCSGGAGRQQLLQLLTTHPLLAQTSNWGWVKLRGYALIWEPFFKPILAMPRFWRRLFLQYIPEEVILLGSGLGTLTRIPYVFVTYLKLFKLN